MSVAVRPGEDGERVSVASEHFGTLEDGTAIERFVVRAGAFRMEAITYGATITALHVPDAGGVVGDVVLGFDSLDDYVTSSPYFGAAIGRCGNRIAKGRFTLDGVSYQLATNDGAHHLHGGWRGFDKVVWRAEPVERDGAAGVAFSYRSPDGEEGYPGTLDARTEYRLTAGGALEIEYQATTDRATIVNLTHHGYFDLSAGRAGDIAGHELRVAASRVTAVGPGLIPTGQLQPVAGTPFDFREGAVIGARVNDDDEQLRYAGGYDHNFVLDAPRDAAGLVHAAQLADPLSGRTMDVHTTEPGLQFYSGNFLDGSLRGKHGRVYGHRAGLCLETQHFPDSPNHAEFPSVVLRPGGTYRSRTIYTFGARRHAGQEAR